MALPRPVTPFFASVRAREEVWAMRMKDYTTITIYHNVQRDREGHLEGFFGYHPEHAVTPVFTYAYPLDKSRVNDAEVLKTLAEMAFVMFNADAEAISWETDRRIARRYRANRLRSLSVGDIVQVAGTLFVCDPIGFRRLMEVELNIQPDPFDNFGDLSASTVPDGYND